MQIGFKNFRRQRPARLLRHLSSSSIIAMGLAGAAAAQTEDRVVVVGEGSYLANSSSSGTRTDTPLVNIPQAISVVTREQIEDQAAQNLADVVRYVPGVSFAQGEGNRDTPIFRGNASTADMFVDGVRDDLQYFRDLYNIERVDVLRGSNGMIFGRGGGGGVINRITRQANGMDIREIAAQASGEGGGRLTADFGQALSEAASVRVTGLYEDSDSYRDSVTYERTGINPTFMYRVGPNTTLRAGYEYYDYDFVADRGVSTFNGVPLAVDPSTFFGDPDRSPTNATINALNGSIEHQFGNGATIRNHTRYADQDKFYQNVFPGAVGGGGATVSISAYNQATVRESLFNQTDFNIQIGQGAIRHNLLIGAEIGHQVTDNFRETGYFTAISPTTTSVNVPVSNPIYTGPIAFRQSATDADNHGVADQYAFYVQDQLELSPQWQVVVGARFDRFEAELRNNRNGQVLTSEDDLFSPRAGLIFKPQANASMYASYSQTFVPRAGEQLASLSATNAALDPEEWENLEVGVKYDLTSRLSPAAAVYRLDRNNVAIADPTAGLPGGTPAGTLILVEGQRVTGLELSLTGNVTQQWSVIASYAYQDSEILADQSAAVQAGAQLGQVPEHSFSLWNRYDFTPSWAAALGVVYVDDRFATTENVLTPASNVLLENYVRVDGALYWTATENLRVQVNVENIFDQDYYLNAHSNTNVTPGSPRTFRVGVIASF